MKRLYRSRQDKVVAGVCGGIAEYLEIDPVVVRILWVISIFFFGLGLPFYLAAIFIIPPNPDQTTVERKKTNAHGWNFGIGTVLIILGVILLLDQFGILHRGWLRFHFFPWRLMWPLALVGIGVYLLASGTTVKKTAEDVKQWAGNSRIRKSRSDKVIAGVCGGLARHFEIDTTVVRLLWAVFTLVTWGFGVLAYIVLAIILPYDEEEESQGAHNSATENQSHKPS